MNWNDGRGQEGDSYSQRGVSPNDQINRLMGLLNWSVPAGRVWGIRVRIHFLFFAFIIYLLVTGDDLVWTLELMAVLFGSVLLHEFGHCAGCRWMKGEADRILIWPLGGLASVAPPQTPLAHLVTVAFGPLVNAALLLLAYATLWGTVADGVPVGWNPFQPWTASIASEWQLVVAMAFVVNYYLLLLNLALAFYPFDGGRLLQVALWRWVGFYKSMYWAAKFGVGAAIAVGLFGFVSGQRMLFYIALFGLFECIRRLQTLKAQAMMGSGFESAYPTTGGATRQDRIAAKELKRRVDEAATQRREIDRILAKVSDQGLQSLTKKEKKLLQQDTDRLRGS